MGLRVAAIVVRHLFLYRRSLARAGEVFFWPVMDLLVWGFLTRYLQEHEIPLGVGWLLGGVIFWDILYRSQQAITLSLHEEIWVRNVLNVFLSPLSMGEYLLATSLMGIIKATLTLAVLGSLAYLFYAFNIWTMGLALVPFVACLLLFGWAVGMVTMAIILRYGQAAEALVWGVPFLLQPFSAVFYPLEALPAGAQVFSRLLPSTYVFEGMRAALTTGAVEGRLLATAFLLDLIYLAFGAAFFAWMFRIVQEKGYLSRLGME
ncbi:MAG: ABC transporter [Candidatus Poribacteria bacterium]|nr:MAG: ABC transporter [Candidatus Poribacteria bacterium]